MNPADEQPEQDERNQEVDVSPKRLIFSASARPGEHGNPAWSAHRLSLIRPLIIVAALAILASACSSSGGKSTTAPATGNQPVSMGVNFSPQSLDPASGSWQLVQLGIGETLTRLDRQGRVQPWLAQSWTNSPDLKT